MSEGGIRGVRKYRVSDRSNGRAAKCGPKDGASRKGTEAGLCELDYQSAAAKRGGIKRVEIEVWVSRGALFRLRHACGEIERPIRADAAVEEDHSNGGIEI